jgi:hypothetical protein
MMRQFKIERSERRIDIVLPVTLTTTDANGHSLEQEIMTVNVSENGALLTGIRGNLRLGSYVSLARLHRLEKFQIAWVGEENTPKAGQIGVSAVDPATSFWSDVVEAQSQAELASAREKYWEKIPAKSGSPAHGS